MKKTEKIKIKETILDASGRTLGRIASEIATILSGKNKASYQRNAYSGTPVKIINASKMRITEEKLKEIIHKRYSGYPGGLKLVSGTEVALKKGFGELIRHAVYKMLPGNKLRREMMKNLKIEN